MNQWSHCNELSNEIVFSPYGKMKEERKGVVHFISLTLGWSKRDLYIPIYIYLLTCSWINFLLSVKYTTYLINLQVSQVKCTWWVYYQWFLILISSSGGTVYCRVSPAPWWFKTDHAAPGWWFLSVGHWTMSGR